ncbi:hypothetical protein Ddc_16804 [Ditylenchus destructor]|nr:hypothetical protein Ddc_16804 [Ditylenchus destructor]
MKYYFTLLTLAIFSFSNAFWRGHKNTPEKEILNAKIKKEFPEILAISSPGNHNDLREVLDDIFEELPLPLNKLLILDGIEGFVVRNQKDQGLELNLLAPLLPPPKYEQAGEVRDPENIYDFMAELANRYVDLLKKEGEDKEIHVVPIAKVKVVPSLAKSRPIILFGVLGKRKGSENNLTGIAGLVAQIK